VRVGVDVEDVADADLADGEHPAVFAAAARQLILGAFHGLLIAIEVERVAYEPTSEPQVGLILADLVSLGAGKARHTQGVVQAGPLIDLAVDPELGPGPKRAPQVEGGVDGLSAAIGRQAVRPRIGCVERGGFLFHVGELAVDREGFGRRVDRSVGRGLIVRRGNAGAAEQQRRDNQGSPFSGHDVLLDG
jgi:hypothetical protein